MKLQDRNLNIGMHGEDVELLQQELRQLGFGIAEEAGYFGSSTRRAVEQFQEENNLEITGMVDERTAALINEAVQALEPEPGGDDAVSSFVVRGYVRKADGSPLVGAIVWAFDKDLRHEEGLGYEVTDESGRYEIAYTAAQFCRAEKKRADLIVRVFDQEDQELITSDILFNAQTEETVNLMIGGGEYRGPSEYEQLLAEITPLLENAPLTELSEEDISFLSSETGLVSQHIEFLALASKRAQETDLPTEIFYGFARQDLPTSLSPLLEQDHKVLRQALETVLTENIIPQRLESSLEEIIAQLQQLAIDQEVKGETSRGALVKTSPFLMDQQLKAFAGAYAQHEGSIEDFWEELGKLPEFSEEGSVEELQLTLQMGEFTQSHLPLVENLQERRQAGTLQSLRDLAKWDLDQWREVIKVVGAPPDVPGMDENERVENYAEIMFETVENDYATAVVTHRLSLEEEAIPGADVLYQFLDQNPEFDLGITDIDSYLGAGADNELVTQLKSWQRVHRISPTHGRYDAMRELKKDGLDSAQAVTRRGPSAFVRDYSGKLGSEEKAQEVWNKASHTAAMALTVFAGYSTAFNNVMPKFIPSPVVTENDVIPNWKELFGSMDFCECEHCKSVYGPAAYFTDLLYFLKEPSNKKALTVLLSRRPDLEKIELSCENTNTVLPYVDLVNEVLEEAVAPGTTSLKLRQTSGKADELSATPEHLNEEAYFKLANAVYPWDLPFDLWFEEAHIYMKHLGLKRYQWMEKLWKEELMKLPPTSKAQEIALDVACDHLGITTMERKFITNDLNQPEETLWGFQQPQDWENELRKVRVFLKKAGYDENESGKNFKELRKLLIGTQFLNIDNTIQILFKREPCDLDKAWIENDQHAPPERRRQEWELILNKARRFLRLQRKLGWTIPELDKTITAFNADLDKDFLQHLSRIERLRNKLSVPLLEILSWWGNIDTAEDRTEKEKSKKTPSLYEQLFLNKAVNNPVNPVFKLNKERTELENHYDPLTPDDSSKWISTYIAYVAAALESKTSDLLLLIDIDKKNKKEVPDQLNLKHLSHLYRIVSLTKALNLTVKEFLSTKAFTGVDPFKNYNNNLTPLQSFEFLEKVQTIQATDFSNIELDYLLRHKYEDKDNIAPTDAEIAKALSEIHSGLKKIEEENTLAPDPQGDLTRKKLGLLLSEDKVPEIFKVISGDSKKTLKEQKKRIDKLLSPYLDANDAKSQLIKPNPTTPAPLNTKPERFAYVLKSLLIYLRTTLSQNLIKQKISTALSFDADTTALLLETLVNAQIDKKKPAEMDFLALSTGGLSAAYYLNNAFTGKPVEQIDSTIDFEWTAKNPPPGAPNTFSVRWSGMVQAEKSGTYTFHVQANGNVRLRVNNQLIVDTWTNLQGPVDAKGTIVLETGKFYPIKMEYRTNNATGSKAKLKWKSPSASEQVISSGNLVPTIIISSYRLLHKFSLLITNFKIQADELHYLSENGTDFENFDLNAFPTDTSGATVNLFKQWERLNQVFTFRDRYPRLETRLIDVFGATANQNNPKKSVEEAKKQLIALTVWDKKELDVLTGDTGFKLTAGDFRKGNKFSELYEAFKLINQLGISAEQLVEWIATDIGSSFGNLNDANFKNKKSVVLTLKQTVKAKYGQKQWLQIAQPLRNELRKNQRDALTSYLVHYYKLKNANQLYDKFLIDVEMDPCMMTSRIKQAISTVQLFVQRCLMNLETEVSLSPAEAREWKWRKNYRVWEANRKVFLYPENWIEPELRDDKSPFFEDLENELLQNEITKDTAETAFIKYLEKLDDVDRLEIVGMYVQDKEHSKDTKKLHVFGRTHGTPHIYYYRQWIDESYWTAWERVDLDIEGDHLIPVVWNRRLYLFWPIFKEEVDQTQEFKKDQDMKKYLKIQFAWSEYKNDKWSAKKVTSEYGKHRLFDPLSDIKSGFTFKAFVTGGGKNLVILSFIGFDAPYMAEVLNEIYSTGYEFKKGPSTSRETLLPARSRVHGMSFIEKSEKSTAGSGSKSKSSVDSLELVTEASGAFLSSFSRQPVLNRTPGRFNILYPHQYLHFSSQSPFFYQDGTRTFSVIPRDASAWEVKKYYQFFTFYHPYVRAFIRQLNFKGIDSLLNPNPSDKDNEAQELYRQSKKNDFFGKTYGNQYKLLPPGFLGPVPVEDIDFSYQGAYSIYNWELFFHIPLLIADRLSDNQRFEDAMKWFHYIFDPTLVPEDPNKEPAPARYWKVRPFFEAKPKRIQILMKLLNQGDNAMDKQVTQWEKNPFKPHVIARLRIGAYMKTVVMKYIDNLIAWGDQLFRRDTIESINEATQLYILAAEILGERPAEIPAGKRKTQTFSDLKGILDKFSNVVGELENKLVVSSQNVGVSGSGYEDEENFTLPTILYFCIPNNDKLLKYWDTVEDRLFKIRYCMNIKGIVRQLPLFQPPIDPALLVRAAAAGIDIGSVLNDLYAPLPNYRFQVILQKATELCADVRSLGASLLLALEKKDAEELALLRSQHEVKLLDMIKDVKEEQIKENKELLEQSKKSKKIAQYSKEYYKVLSTSSVVGSETGIASLAKMREKQYLVKQEEAHSIQEKAVFYEWIGQILNIAPTMSFPVAIGVSMSVGGSNLGAAANAYSRSIAHMARKKSHQAMQASTMGQHARVKSDWVFQVARADKEIEQIDKQIAAAEIREAISEKELKNHELQITNAQEVDTYMKNKFTNKQLYNWMVSQISAFYFQSYQLAYDLAKRAEKAFQHELGVSDTNFIQFGYWDSLKKGLLAGEKLHYDLKRMEVAYLEQNKREYELAKHVSLAMLDPVALIKLKETGKCFVNIPEAVFDLDYPGHYMRRIKSVSLSIPCVTGPYTSVSCTLTLHKHTTRIKSDLSADSLKETFGAVQSIATSSAQNDSGIFDLNFRDERYLPFEGAGVISEWRIELPDEFRQFDYDTISDVIFHINYTARDGGGTFKNAVNKELEGALKKMELGDDRTGIMQVFSAKHEFSGEWHRFFQLMKEENEQGYKHKLELDFSKDRFPYQFRHKTITVTNMSLFVKLKDLSEGKKYNIQSVEYDLKRTDKDVNNAKKEFKKYTTPNGEELEFLLCSKPIDKKNIKLTKKENWSFEVKETHILSPLWSKVKIDGVTHNRLNPDVVEDMFLVFQYYIKE